MGTWRDSGVPLPETQQPACHDRARPAGATLPPPPVRRCASSPVPGAGPFCGATPLADPGAERVALGLPRIDQAIGEAAVRIPLGAESVALRCRAVEDRINDGRWLSDDAAAYRTWAATRPGATPVARAQSPDYRRHQRERAAWFDPAGYVAASPPAG